MARIPCRGSRSQPKSGCCCRQFPLAHRRPAHRQDTWQRLPLHYLSPPASGGFSLETYFSPVPQIGTEITYTPARMYERVTFKKRVRTLPLECSWNLKSMDRIVNEITVAAVAFVPVPPVQVADLPRLHLRRADRTGNRLQIE